MSETKRYIGDLRGAVDFISEPAKSALKSKLIEESERKALVQALARFEGAIKVLSEIVPDDDKPDLARAILGAFEIGSKATDSESAAAHTRRKRAAEMRHSKSEKPDVIAAQEAIVARRKVVADVSKGHALTKKNCWKVAGKIEPKVNRILKTDKPVKQKQIYDDLLLQIEPLRP